MVKTLARFVFEGALRRSHHGGPGGAFERAYYSYSAPNRDGYLTLGEALWQWNNGNGAPVWVDLTKLTLPEAGLRELDEIGASIAVTLPDPYDFMVHGTITLKRTASGLVAPSGLYDFDMKPWRGHMKRNTLTLGGAIAHGTGRPFMISYVGEVPVR